MKELLKNNIDLLDIIFMMVSLIIAVFIPFKLFLFSYAVLGPLHYLTEINWLREKNFFMLSDRKFAVVFTLVAIMISLSPSINHFEINLYPSVQSFVDFIARYESAFLIGSFLFAIGLLFYTNAKTLIVLLISVSILSFLLTNYSPSRLIYVALFVPTLIHVYVFTLLFILYGSIKSKSRTGVGSVFVLGTVPFVIMYLPVEIVEIAQPSKETLNTFIQSSFATVSGSLAKSFGALEDGQFNLLSEMALRIQIFIAFAYTYHYLNWFSKTSIIGWSKSLSKQKMTWILIIYAFSLGIFYYDYKTGLVALFFLSFLHVLLEFPLNVLSIKGVFSEVLEKIKA